MAQLMERALKERIVGAVVLVVFAILVVPVFLDGPQQDAEVISESVTLPGQNGQPRKRQTIVLNRDRTEPVPVPADNAPDARDEDVVPTPDSKDAASESPKKTAAPPPAAPPSEEKSGAEAANTGKPPPETKAEEEVRSSTGMWAVQLGSFAKPDNAERLAADLRSKGYAAFLSQLKGPDGPLHRVRIGPQKDRESAEKTAEKLAADGHKGQVVPHP